MNADDARTSGGAGHRVSVRAAVATDAERLNELAQAAYGPYVSEVGRPPAPMTADYGKIANSGYAWVAEQQGRVVGLLVLEPHTDYLLLENIAVHPDRQGAGVGNLLLAFAERQARLLGLPEVHLFTNAAMTKNLQYYTRREYRETHRAEHDGYQRVFFTKQLHNH